MQQKFKNQTEMVGTKFRTVKWSAISLIDCRGVNTGRYLSKRLGGNMQWNLNRGMWSAQEMKNHINILELLALKLAIQTFSKALKLKAIHLQVDNMVALTY